MTGRLVAVGVLTFGAGYLLRSWACLRNCLARELYLRTRLAAAERDPAHAQCRRNEQRQSDAIDQLEHEQAIDGGTTLVAEIERHLAEGNGGS